MTSPADLGPRLKARRLELDLAVRDVADHLGTDKQNVYRYEKGEMRPSDAMKARLMDVLDVDAAFFFETCDR